MRKISVLFVILITSLSVTYAYELTENDEKIVEIISEQIEEKTETYQNNFSNTLELLISDGNYSNRVEAILSEIIVNIQNNLIATETEEIQNNIDIKDENKAEENIFNVNFDQVKNDWLQWNNQTREILGLDKYGFDSTLEQSANIWSESAKNQGEISHKRAQSDGFYNYESINQWFGDNGVVCENKYGFTHTENIWWGAYTCSDGECSKELSDSMYRAYTSYMNEKGTDSDAHYRSLTNEYFSNIGLGIAIDEIKDNYYEYYLTIHYCTELIQ